MKDKFTTKLEKEIVNKNIYFYDTASLILAAVSAIIGIILINLFNFNSIFVVLICLFCLLKLITSPLIEIIYTKEDVDLFMKYYTSLDYIVDEEKQTVFIKSENGLIEEVAIDYIDYKTKILRQQEQKDKELQNQDLRYKTIHEEDFETFKKFKEKHPSNLNAEMFHNLQTKAKLRNPKKKKSSYI